jgi:predicted adenine nucleotide alpha hydrolase (AANH) superfamily ATPase
VRGLFANPNIYPEEEHDKRWDVYKGWAAAVDLQVSRVVVPRREWLDAIGNDTEKPGRCGSCYRFRMKQAAFFAKEAGSDAFTTSLLISPYQDREAVIRAMEEASETTGVPFLCPDFRPGYRRSRQMARGAHLYMQKYCGCEFSLKEGS